MKHMVSLIFLCSFIFNSGCMISRQPQNLFQDQLSFILQEQKTQTEAHQQLQDKLMDLEKILQEIDSKLLTASVAQRAESIASNQTEISTLMEFQGIHPAELMKTGETFTVSPDEVVRGGKKNAQKIDGVEQPIAKLERDFPKSNMQTGIITEKRGETRGVGSQKENARKVPEKHKNLNPDYLYEQALEAFGKQEYQNALNLLGDLTHNFPAHELASNAYFWQGEACYQMQDFNNAVLMYNMVIEKYAESSKYPSALLKMGLSGFALNKNREGELRLEELIRKFPDRPESKRAVIFLNSR